MKTLIYIHGGDSFATEESYLKFMKEFYIPMNLEPWKSDSKTKWRDVLSKKWIENWGIVYCPTMPNKQRALYSDWKMVFEALVEKLQTSEDEIYLIGGSLGWCFLLKYFSEEQPKLNIKEIHLIAACISEGDFTAPTNYDFLRKFGEKVHIWHAEDDDIVPFSVGKEISEELPQAITHFFAKEKWYGHFHKLETLPELEEILISK